MIAWIRPALLLASALLVLGCGSKREVKTDAGKDATAARPLSAVPGGDGGLASDGGAGPSAADAGPADDSLPPPSAPDLASRGKHLLEAIVQDNPDLASDILFPRDAFVASRDVADPTKVWEKKVSGAFARDVHTLSRRVKGKDAQLTALEVGQAIQRIVPKRRDFKKPLWKVKHSKLLFTVEGKPQRIEIAEMVSWRGAWYVTKLR